MTQPTDTRAAGELDEAVAELLSCITVQTPTMDSVYQPVRFSAGPRTDKAVSRLTAALTARAPAAQEAKCICLKVGRSAHLTEDCPVHGQPAPQRVEGK